MHASTSIPAPGASGPDPVLAAQDQHAETAIATYGYVVCFVPCAAALGAGPIPFGYTVGLAESFGHPEVVVTGMARPFSDAFLDRVARGIAAGGRLAADQPTPRICTVPVVFKPANPARAASLLSVALRRAAQRGAAAPQVLQAVFPDTSMRFPWETHFDPRAAHPHLALYQ